MTAVARRTVLGMALLASCSHAPRTAGSDRNIIKSDEIASVEATNAYDVVRKLRPEFLKSRGTVTRSGRSQGKEVVTQETPALSVFVDGIEAGPAESALPAIPAVELFQLRLYRAADAVTKYGSRHNGGVLEVTTRRTTRP